MKTKSCECRGSSIFPLYRRRVSVQEGTYIRAGSRFPSNMLTSLQKLFKYAEPLATQALSMAVSLLTHAFVCLEEVLCKHKC